MDFGTQFKKSIAKSAGFFLVTKLHLATAVSEKLRFVLTLALGCHRSGPASLGMLPVFKCNLATSQCLPPHIPPFFFAPLRLGVSKFHNVTKPIHALASLVKYRLWKYEATLTKPIRAGTSTNGPITAANAAPKLMPKTATATVIANSNSCWLP